MKAVKFLIAILLIAAFLALLISYAKSEDTDCWILCQPDSFVYARTLPKKKSAELGRLECGDHIYTDGKTKNGFLHIYGLSFESDEGWVHKGYVVYGEPYKPFITETHILSNGRVNARKTVNGKRRCWLKNGTKIRVYMASEEWSITNKGFVKTKYIDLGR